MATPGDTWAVQLPSGRWGVLRAVSSTEGLSERLRAHFGRDAMLITVAHQTFDEQPGIGDVDPERGLYIDDLVGQDTNRDPRKHLGKFYVAGDPPVRVGWIGNRPPTKREQALAGFDLATWDFVAGACEREDQPR